VYVINHESIEMDMAEPKIFLDFRCILQIYKYVDDGKK